VDVGVIDTVIVAVHVHGNDQGPPVEEL